MIRLALAKSNDAIDRKWNCPSLATREMARKIGHWALPFRKNLSTRKSIQKWRICDWFWAQKKKQWNPISWHYSKVRSWIWCFLIFIFRWYPLRIGYEQLTIRDKKTLKVASVLLFRHILKTKLWLECGSSLLNSRMWPGILRDLATVPPFSQ